MEKSEGLYPSVPPQGQSAPQGYVQVNQQPQYVMATPPAVFGPNAQSLTCPYCHQEVITAVRAEASTKTHIIAVLLCFVWCCCIPYCVDSCKNKNHYCPSCNAFLGAYVN